ncbi:SusC/RagA family TonB-linked outer membrane protein [Rhodohalobacter sp. 614A]|uniref:SusC/RagA family TonB-linked outer membrane protein n=1 Tax=Rhodohalobacter sp. 614A TaxID=2908649 RepID=UPI001F29F167|nr:TonB-dependent receptor [Rhodohalobacter sp. 614A]
MNAIMTNVTNKTWRRVSIFLAIFLFGYVGQAQTLGSLYTFQKGDSQLYIEEGLNLKNALEQVEQYYNVGLLYRSNIVEGLQTRQAGILSNNVEEALSFLLEGSSLRFKYLNPKTYGIYESFELRKADERVINSALQVIRGKVIDSESGEALPGVNVIVQGGEEVSGSLMGTSTDMEGNYEIQIPDSLNTLIFTYIGYQRLEVEINGRSEINVELIPDVQMLEDLVVVGFGQSQRVENLTGSVSSISASTIEDRPLTQSSQSLAGQVSGVTVLQSSGNPGEDQATINIRGLNTFSSAGNSPLVLVDGIAANINDVNPSDIQSVSILKDAASAAIYGSRGANGVILVETKKGRSGALQAEYNAYVGWTKPTELIELVDAATYAEMQNEALRNQGQSPAYSQEEIDKFRSGIDPENYPDLNQYNLLMDSGNPIQTNHDLRFSGGDDINTYSLSIGYLNKDGLMVHNNYERYNARLNLNSQITEKLNVALNLSGHEANHSQLASPGNQARSHPEGIIQTSIKVPPTIGGQRPDGTYGRLADFTIPGWLASDSERNLEEQYLLGTFQINYNLLENFKVNATASYRNKVWDTKHFKGEVQLDESVTLGPSELIESRNEESLLTLQSTFEYSQDINVHSFKILGGYSQEEFERDFIEAYRDNFPNNNLRELNAGDAGNQQSSGTSGVWALQSVFGRLNYSYDEKYLFESNLRYDGSSRFPEENRYGLFPSASIGWRISEEGFFTINWIDELKVRASYGQIGNQEIGLYPYQLTLSLGNNYVFGDSFVPGAAAELLPNRDIRWETTTTFDLGLDFELIENRIRGTIDYFDKETDDILFGISSSAILGLTPAEQNAGSVRNNGLEFSLEYRDNFGDFFFSIAPNFSIVHNEVTSLANVERDIEQGLFVGESVQSIYGFEADGLFVDENDINSWPEMPFEAKPGDIRLKDLNGDGMVTFEGDRKIIGNRFPKYNFGATVSGGYKSFDFNIQLHGVAGVNAVHNNGEAFRAFYLGTTPQKWQIENRFQPDNPSRDAKYPLLENVSEGDRNALVSTYWLRDASFLRIRDITVGYTLPVDVTDIIGIREARIYFNGNNLFTFDSFFPGWEPEMNGFYPLTKSLNFGVNIKI